MDKKSFLIYLDYEEQFNLLNDEQVGQLMRAIIRYEKTGEVPILDGMLKMAFSFMKTQLDRDRQKYKSKCEKNKQNGKKGGRPKKNQTEKEKTEKSEGFLKEPKKADKDKEDDEEEDKDNDKDTTSKLVSKDAENLQKVILETLGNTNLTVIKDAINYLDILPFEVVQEALKRTARKQKKWDYAQGTLNNWIRDGLDSIEKIKANDLEHQRKNVKQKNAETTTDEDFEQFYAN